MTKINHLNFKPHPGLWSRHFQTILASYKASGTAPPTQSKLIYLPDNDQLSCEISTPLHWKNGDTTVALVHGLGGCHRSAYMIRLARLFYHKGIKVIRINLRGCGSGSHLARLPYNGGTSEDLLKVIEQEKCENPLSKINLIGFSLGGNVVLKLAGELGREAPKFVNAFISVCAPLDLAESIALIQSRRNSLYHRYYVKKVTEQGVNWLKNKIETLYEFDQQITAPLWGYKGADDYYQQCSSQRFIGGIQHHCHIIYAEDDPFVRTDPAKHLCSSHVNFWSSKHGGHMGFLGATPKVYKSHWLDYLLLNWIVSDFSPETQKAFIS